MRTLLPALLTLLLRACRPAPGRQRALTARTGWPPAPPKPLRRRPPAQLPAQTEPLCGEDAALVRPYLVAHERRQRALLQRERRTALVLASMGIDYACEVAA